MDPGAEITPNCSGYLLKRPVGHPPIEVWDYANFSYQVQSWRLPRRVVAKAAGRALSTRRVPRY